MVKLATAEGEQLMATRVMSSMPRKPKYKAPITKKKAGMMSRRLTTQAISCGKCALVLLKWKDAPRTTRANMEVALLIWPKGFKIGAGTLTPEKRQMAPTTAPMIIGFLKTLIKTFKGFTLPPRKSSRVKTPRTWYMGTRIANMMVVTAISEVPKRLDTIGIPIKTKLLR